MKQDNGLIKKGIRRLSFENKVFKLDKDFVNKIPLNKAYYIVGFADG